jgi:hypothetical protein
VGSKSYSETSDGVALGKASAAVREGLSTVFYDFSKKILCNCEP